MIWTLPIVALVFVADRPASYRHEVVAVLARAGCNSGACHGNLNGKGGFHLSLRGEDPAADYLTLTREARGRRVDATDPTASLMLRKAAGQTPHEGGVRFSPSSPEYAAILSWIAAGARDDGDRMPKLAKLTVTPERAVVPHELDHVAIQATATYTDGTHRDVTRLCAIDLNSVGTARVSDAGVVERQRPGEVVALVRYLGTTVPVSIAFVPARPIADLSAFNTSHPIDKLAASKWAELRLLPAPRASDSLFLRRATLDATGVLPSADEARAFLADIRPDKRARLVDDLLTRPAYANYWAQKWADLLRVEERSLDKKGVQVFHRWLLNAVAADKPLTELAAEVLAGMGSTYQNPPANFYRSIREPYGRAEAVAQVFLGLRVGCARCHNHPFDVWTQSDYHRFAAVFARIGYRESGGTKSDKLDKHEFVGDQVVYRTPTGELDDPRGGIAPPQLLGNKPMPADADRLDTLATWVASPENPHFARAQANRVWLHLLGQGLVDPGDDFRATNPATNPLFARHASTARSRAIVGRGRLDAGGLRADARLSGRHARRRSRGVAEDWPSRRLVDRHPVFASLRQAGATVDLRMRACRRPRRDASLPNADRRRGAKRAEQAKQPPRPTDGCRCEGRCNLRRTLFGIIVALADERRACGDLGACGEA